MTPSSSIFDDGERLMEGTILIYGATGYTGKLIAKAAVECGVRPILAGRNIEKVKAVVEPLGLIGRAFDLGAADDPRRGAQGRFGRPLCRRPFFRDGAADGGRVYPQPGSLSRHHRGN